MKDMVGFLEEPEAKLLQEYAKKSPDIVVEIGTFHGKSVVYMSQEKEVITIDPYEYKYFDENVKKFGKHKITKIIEKAEDVKWDKPIGMLFIDGEHNGWQIKTDYEKYEPFIVKGGYLIFHDTLWKEISDFLEERQEEFKEKFIISKQIRNVLCLEKK